MTDTEANAQRAEATPEQKTQRHVVKALSRALAKVEGDGSREDTKKRWDEGKAKYTADARKLVKALIRDGVSFSVNEEETAKAKRAARKAAKTDDVEA